MYKPHFEKKDGQRLLHILLTLAVVLILRQRLLLCTGLQSRSPSSVTVTVFVVYAFLPDLCLQETQWQA